jgi:hypothetical protein
LYDDVKYDANDDDSNYVKYYETVYVNYDAHPSHNKLHHYYKHSQIIQTFKTTYTYRVKAGAGAETGVESGSYQ